LKAELQTDAHQSSELLTEKELGKRWKLDPKTLRNWRCQGRGPNYLKIAGANVRYALDEIVRHEQQSIHGGES
jgi:hypothetical protein